MPQFPLLSASDIGILQEALFFLHVAELKAILRKLHLPFDGKKAVWIERILAFIQTGEFPRRIGIAAACSAHGPQQYPLHPDTLILSGAYKNDAATRAFFKELIGPHFHFTVFGHDWIRKCWENATPPTYAAFAEFWSGEYERRKSKAQPLKKEWAYLNFAREFLAKNPKASRRAITQAWNQARSDSQACAHSILNRVLMALSS